MRFAFLLFPALVLARTQTHSRAGVTEHVTLNLRPGVSVETTDADVQNQVFQQAGNWSGFQDGYWGLELGDAPQTAYWFFNWDSIAAHQAFTKSPIYPSTLAAAEFLALSFSAPHVSLQPFPPSEVFSSPIVSWLTFNLTGLDNSTAASNWRESTDGFLGNLSSVSEYGGHSSGWQVEDGRVFSVLVGWESVEALGMYVFGSGFKEEFRRLMRGVEWECRVLRVVGYVPKL